MEKKLLLLFTVFLLACTAINEVKEMPKNAKLATFAGGCFWCMEAAFEDMDGIIDVVSGYTGGAKESPSYEEVSSGTTNHFESIQVTYDPEKISYSQLLGIFWRQIDPTDAQGQFSDRGPQYRTAIFYNDSEEEKIAEESKKEIQKKFEKPIATQILEAKKFYKAEEYHQDYSKKRTLQYKLYEKGSGRKDYIKKTWEDEK